MDDSSQPVPGAELGALANQLPQLLARFAGGGQRNAAAASGAIDPALATCFATLTSLVNTAYREQVEQTKFWQNRALELELRLQAAKVAE